jgi:hypothetical protein
MSAAQARLIALSLLACGLTLRDVAVYASTATTQRTYRRKPAKVDPLR